MSAYIKYQYKKMLLIAVVFLIASLSPFLIKNPTEIIGPKGIILIAMTIISLIFVEKYEAFLSVFSVCLSLFEKKEYRKNEILKFYGIKHLEINEDIAFIRTTERKTIGYAIIRVFPFPYPFQHLSEEEKERYRRGWLNVLQGIDFKCFFKIQSKLFDIQKFRDAISTKMDSINDLQAKSRLKKLLDLVESSARESIEKRFYIVVPQAGKRDEAEKALRTKVDNLLSLLRVNLDLEAKRLGQDETIEEIGSHFNPGIHNRISLEKAISKDESLKDNGKITIDLSDSQFFSVDKLKINRNKIITDSSKEKIVNMFLKVRKFPSKLSFDWLPRLLDTTNCSYDLVIELTPLDVNKTIQTLDANIRNKSIDIKAITLSGSIPPQSMVENVESEKKILKAFVLGEEKPYNVSIYGRVYNALSDESDGAVKKVLDVLCGAINGHGFLTEKVGYNSLKEIAKKTFVAPTLLKEEERLTLSSYATDIFPFGCNTFLSSDANPDGIFIGCTEPSGAPFIIEPRKLPNQIMTVLGMSGYGKSTLTETLVTRFNDLGVGSLIIDIQGEYIKYVLDRRGIVLSFGYEKESEGVHTTINLLGLYGFPLPERKRQLLSLFSTVFPDLSFQAIGFLRQSLDQTYSERGMFNDNPSTWDAETPTITDLVSLIRKNKEKTSQTEKVIWEAIERRLGEFARGGGYAFFDGKTNLQLEDLAKKLACVNLKPLHSRFAKSLVAHTILQLILGSFGVLKEFRYLVVDEGWFLLENATEENLLIEITKTGRKFNSGVIFISQNLGDIQGKARTILNNAAIKVLFRIDETEIRDVTKCFRLTPILADQATKLKVGEALIKTVNIPTWVRVSVQREEVETQEVVSGTFEKAKQIPQISEIPDPIMQSLSQDGLCPILMSNFNEEFLSRMKEQGIEFITVGKMRGGNTTYAYNKNLIQNPKHESLVMEVCSFLDENKIAYETSKTREPDIVSIIPPFKIAIEIETGTHSVNKIKEKISRIIEKFDFVYILVDSQVKIRYGKNLMQRESCKLVNRSDLVKEIEKLKKVEMGVKNWEREKLLA